MSAESKQKGGLVKSAFVRVIPAKRVENVESATMDISKEFLDIIKSSFWAKNITDETELNKKQKKIVKAIEVKMNKLFHNIINSTDAKFDEKLTLAQAYVYMSYVYFDSDIKEEVLTERYLLRCIELLKEKELHRKAIIIVIAALNKLGYMWIKLAHPENARSFLSKAEKLYLMYTKETDKYPIEIAISLGLEPENKDKEDSMLLLKAMNTVTLERLIQAHKILLRGSDDSSMLSCSAFDSKEKLIEIIRNTDSAIMNVSEKYLTVLKLSFKVRNFKQESKFYKSHMKLVRQVERDMDKLFFDITQLKESKFDEIVTLAQAYIFIGTLYNNSEETRKIYISENYFSKCMKLLKGKELDRKAIMIVIIALHNLANIWIKLKDLEKSKSFLKKSLQLYLNYTDEKNEYLTPIDVMSSLGLEHKVDGNILLAFLYKQTLNNLQIYDNVSQINFSLLTSAMPIIENFGKSKLKDTTINISEEYLDILRSSYWARSITLGTKFLKNQKKKMIKTIEVKMDRLFNDISNSKDAKIDDIVALAQTYINIAFLYSNHKGENLRTSEDNLLKCMELLAEKETDCKSIITAITALNELGNIYIKFNDLEKSRVYLDMAMHFYLTYTKEKDEYPIPIDITSNLDIEKKDSKILLEEQYSRTLTLSQLRLDTEMSQIKLLMSTCLASPGTEKVKLVENAENVQKITYNTSVSFIEILTLSLEAMIDKDKNTFSEEYSEMIRSLDVRMNELFQDIIKLKKVTFDEILMLAQSYINMCNIYIGSKDKQELHTSKNYLMKCIELLKGKELNKRAIILILIALNVLGYIWIQLDDQQKSKSFIDKAIELYVTYQKRSNDSTPIGSIMNPGNAEKEDCKLFSMEYILDPKTLERISHAMIQSNLISAYSTSITEARMIEDAQSVKGTTVDVSERYREILSSAYRIVKIMREIKFIEQKDILRTIVTIVTTEASMNKLFHDLIKSKDAKLDEIVTLAQAYTYIAAIYIYNDEVEMLYIGDKYLLRCMKLLKEKELDCRAIITAITALLGLACVCFKLKMSNARFYLDKAVQLYSTYTKEENEHPVYIAGVLGIEEKKDGELILEELHALILDILNVHILSSDSSASTHSSVTETRQVENVENIENTTIDISEKFLKILKSSFEIMEIKRERRIFSKKRMKTVIATIATMDKLFYDIVHSKDAKFDEIVTLAQAYVYISIVHINNTEKLCTSEKHLLNCMELLKEKELDRKAIIIAITALNTLGNIWIQLDDLEKSKSFLDNAMQLYSTYTKKKDEYPTPVDIAISLGIKEKKDCKVSLEEVHAMTLYLLMIHNALLQDVLTSSCSASIAESKLVSVKDAKSMDINEEYIEILKLLSDMNYEIELFEEPDEKTIRAMEEKLDKFHDEIQLRNITFDKIVILAQVYLYMSTLYDEIQASERYLLKCTNLLKEKELNYEAIIVAITAFNELGSIWLESDPQKSNQFLEKAMQLYLTYTKEKDNYPAPINIDGSLDIESKRNERLKKVHAITLNLLKEHEASSNVDISKSTGACTASVAEARLNEGTESIKSTKINVSDEFLEIFDLSVWAWNISKDKKIFKKRKKMIRELLAKMDKLLDDVTKSRKDVKFDEIVILANAYINISFAYTNKVQQQNELNIRENSLSKSIELLRGKELDRKAILLSMIMFNEMGSLRFKQDEYEKAKLMFGKAMELFFIYIKKEDYPIPIDIACNINILMTDCDSKDTRLMLNKLNTLSIQGLLAVYSATDLDSRDNVIKSLHIMLNYHLNKIEQFSINEYINWTSVLLTSATTFHVKFLNFVQARKYLAIASFIIQKFYEKMYMKVDEIMFPSQKIKYHKTYQIIATDIATCWTKYGLHLLQVSIERLQNKEEDKPCEASNSKSELSIMSKEKYPELLSDIRENIEKFALITDQYLLNYNDAKAVLMNILKNLDKLKTYYILKMDITMYVTTICHISKAYKYFAYYEQDKYDQIKLHKQRVSILKDTLKLLDPKVNLDMCEVIWFELGNIYSTLVAINIEIINKLSMELIDLKELIKSTIYNYQSYLNASEDNT